MKIVACIKRVPSTDVLAKIGTDGKSLEAAGVQYMTSFYDEIAVEQAIRTKEALGGEVTVLTLGPADASKEVRESIAKGADAGVLLVDAAWDRRDCLSTAKLLAAKLRTLGADVAFFGKVATDRDNSAVGPMVATMLGWACVSEAIEVVIENGKGRAKRETESGIEELEFSLPAVITCNKGLNEPRYAGLKGIMAAKKKPLDESPAGDVAGATEVLKLELPPPRPPGRIVGQGVEALPELIRALRTEAKVL